MEQSVKIAPEFGSSALRSSLSIIFVSCCKYKFDFCRVKSVLASENDIFVDGSSKETSRPAGDGTFCGLSELWKHRSLSGQSRGVDVEILSG